MKEPVKELSIERIKELLGNKKLSDETITKVMDRIKRFCKVAYELYLKKNKPKNIVEAEVVDVDKEMEQHQEYKKVAQSLLYNKSTRINKKLRTKNIKYGT